MRPLIMDKKRPFTKHRNDAIDFYHAVVPVAYCDFVIRDKSWDAQANHACHCLKRGGNVRADFEGFLTQKRRA